MSLLPLAAPTSRCEPAARLAPQHNRHPGRPPRIRTTPVRRFPLDAAILFADLPQVAAALGQTLDYYRVGDGPVLTPPVRTAADIAGFLSVSRLHEELAPVYETVRQLTAPCRPR
jgi:uroporphyrinogen decarboxylase